MLIVQKYGGTSVANIERIKTVAAYVVDTVRRGNRVVVVVSAMAGETDRLLKLGSVAPNCDRELDALLATGETISAALTAASIAAFSGRAVSLSGQQVRIVTDSNYQRARIKYIETDRINKLLEEGCIVVVAGFQGVDEEGNVTTIGRGGSDTSAVALAAALKADCCEIYSDVDGVFSADPNICPSARRIERMSYEELLETAGAGAKVVHVHAVELAAKHGVPLHLKKSPSILPPPFAKGGDNFSIPPLKKGGEGGFGGTIVTREEIGMEKVLVSSITHTSNEAKISVRSVPDKTGVVARLFEPMARANINVDMIVEGIASNGTVDISFTIAKHDLRHAMQITEVAARAVGAGKVEAAGDVAKISIVGLGMRSHAGVASRMFETLAREDVDIKMISTSEIKVSVVVDAKQLKKAVNALHEAFI